MLTDKEIMLKAQEDITNLTDKEYDRYLKIESSRKSRMVKRAERANGGMIKGFSPIARPQRFKGVF
tara:strand:+ start:385 stop:582 length:198 start_codon:yes stop_codon:yes gene_type:complete